MSNSVGIDVFLNADEDNFFLLTDKCGRFALTGEAKSSKIKASKHLRLALFCSSSITNNDFNVRIYLIDDLLVALQVLLHDFLLFFINFEKEILIIDYKITNKIGSFN